MNRRDLLKGIMGTAAAAPVVKAAVSASPPACTNLETINKPHCGLTDKQTEVILALLNPKIRMVLFSGGRGCGRSFVAQEWAKSIIGDTYEQRYASRQISKLAVFGQYSTFEDWDSLYWTKHFHKALASRDSLIGWGRFERVIVEEAHAIESTDLMKLAAYLFDRAEGKTLLTAVPSGPGVPWLRGMFPDVGWNGPDRFHVNASMWDNPHLGQDFHEIVNLMPSDLRSAWTKGAW